MNIGGKNNKKSLLSRIMLAIGFSVFIFSCIYLFIRSKDDSIKKNLMFQEPNGKNIIGDKAFYALDLVDKEASNLNSVPFSTPILTLNGSIYVCYVNSKMEVIVAKKKSDTSLWEKTKIHENNTNDAHNICSIGADKNGYIHTAFDMHAQPLHYARSLKPEDISDFEFIDKMNGEREDRVSYPHFYLDSENNLFFLYRNTDKSDLGGDDICIKKYDVGRKVWFDLFCPLVNGANGEFVFTPYESGLLWDEKSNMHFFWNPRLVSKDVRNFDISYARYDSTLNVWTKAGGEKIELPIMFNGDVVDRISAEKGLSNQNSSILDSLGRPHIAYLKDVDKNTSEIFHSFFDGNEWVISQATKLGFKKQGRLWSLGRPQIINGADNDIYIFFTDSGNSTAKNYALPAANLYFIMSEDFGKNWTEPKKLDVPKSGEFVYDYLYYSTTGNIRFFYQTTINETSPLYVLDIKFVK